MKPFVVQWNNKIIVYKLSVTHSQIHWIYDGKIDKQIFISRWKNLHTVFHIWVAFLCGYSYTSVILDIYCS
ncbi:Hypothetical predicted protein [Octopus vulgaris]|uniref:Uncharacterized protein n=1 Tax=Octopus vulgaris TaxID=6645 RepID=A0AA36AS59_OCTVU|nr:Hypothetical predicted protein [Octopus vulgaris]